jgi:hypothetical protein
MKTYNLSALSKKGRADIFNEAEKDGVIIQDCNTNGDVRREYVLVNKDAYLGIEKLALDKLADIAIDELG